MLLGKGRHLGGVIDDEGWLNELGLYKFTENFVDNFAAADFRVEFEAEILGGVAKLLF